MIGSFLRHRHSNPELVGVVRDCIVQDGGSMGAGWYFLVELGDHRLDVWSHHDVEVMVSFTKPAPTSIPGPPEPQL